LYLLKPSKHVEADNGYVGAANKTKFPDNPCNPVKNKRMQSRIQSCHKTVNGQFKMWGILKEVYHQVVRQHGKVYQAIAIITQLAIKNGSPLFQVKYED
jgi:hypothetical protein